VLIELWRSFRILALLPGIGHARPDLTDDARIRFWSVYSYLIAFLPAERPLLIARILHGARDPEDLREALREDTAEGSSLPQ
jgi:plasmid stabilization system protein ParE